MDCEDISWQSFTLVNDVLCKIGLIRKNIFLVNKLNADGFNKHMEVYKIMSP